MPPIPGARFGGSLTRISFARKIQSCQRSLVSISQTTTLQCDWLFLHVEMRRITRARPFVL